MVGAMPPLSLHFLTSVVRCRLTVSNPALKGPMGSALETMI